MRHALVLLIFACLVIPPLEAQARQTSKTTREAKPTKRAVKKQIKKLRAASAAIRELATTPPPKELDEAQLETYAAEMVSLTALADGTDAVITKLELGLEDPDISLDAMSEMGEMESLRLQMAMDRLSKLMSTMSNILKKQSETSDNIIKNLK
jgi:hypothetical protein